MAADLQDQASVHHIQQAAGENPLLVVGNVLRGRKAQLLQVHRPEQLLLVDHGAEVSVEQPAALRVTDGHRGTHLLPSVEELHLQVCHWVRGKWRQMLKPCLMHNWSYAPARFKDIKFHRNMCVVIFCNFPPVNE